MSGEGMIAEPRAVHGDAGMVRLKQLMARGTEFLGTEWAILGGAMSWVSASVTWWPPSPTPAGSA